MFREQSGGTVPLIKVSRSADFGATKFNLAYDWQLRELIKHCCYLTIIELFSHFKILTCKYANRVVKALGWSD